MNTRRCCCVLLSMKVLVVVVVLAELLHGVLTTGHARTTSPVLHLANGEWPPYTGEHLPHYGCDSHVVSEVFAQAGIRVQYRFLPWARGKLLSKSGTLDGTIEWADTSEHRASHFISNQALSEQQWVFFHRRDAVVQWQHLEDLKHLHIGLTIGYAYSDVFKPLQAKYPAMFSEAASDLINFKKLLNYRLDLVPLERGVGSYLLRTTFSPQQQQQIVAHDQAISHFSPRLLLSRAVDGNEQRMQLFDQGLERLKVNGRYREIMASCSAEAL